MRLDTDTLVKAIEASFAVLPVLTASSSHSDRERISSMRLPKQYDFRNFLMSEECAEMVRLVANLA